MRNQIATIMGIHLFSIMAFADASEALVKAQGVIDSLSNPMVGIGAVMAVELILRAKKTGNPQSLLYMISNVFKLLAKACTFGASTLDGVLQRLKDQPTK